MRKQILDHGYLSLVESWGSDEGIIAAARMSTSGSFRGWGTAEKPGDEKLLRYLWERRHETPFEMAGLTVEVQAPIMVFREWVRHRTLSLNEMSARYAPLPDVNYLPTVERCLAADTKNKQAAAASGAAVLDGPSANCWLMALEESYQHAEKVYQAGLRNGVPKELARLCLPVGRYSRMRASANLRSWLAFLKLRLASDAQHEIRVYAQAVAEIISEKFPRTYTLFAETLSR